jgi:predicted nucleotidyltransferase
MQKFLEYKASDFTPLLSLKVKNKLNPDFWIDGKLNPEYKEKMLTIGQDFFEELELGIDYSDILFVGSLANMNWSEYSDIDIHVIVDFSESNLPEAVWDKYRGFIKYKWQQEHNIEIGGFPVELYYEDVNQGNVATGVYSLLKDEWLEVPSEIDDEPNLDIVKDKATSIMDEIDSLNEDYLKRVDYDKFVKKLDKTKTKLKRMRQDGLREDGEYSIGNLVFKFLRRNGYIDILLKLKAKAYDKQFAQ